MLDLNLIEEKLKKFKELSKADYAIFNTDEYGDCATCVNYELSQLYGQDSTGVFAKLWREGMNAIDEDTEINTLFFNHDLKESQYKTFLEVFSEDFLVEPKEYDPKKTICVKKKRA